MSDRYGKDVLSAGWQSKGRLARPTSRALEAVTGTVVEDVETGWVGAVVAVGAPTSLAVSLAVEADLLLVAVGLLPFALGDDGPGATALLLLTLCFSLFWLVERGLGGRHVDH